MAKKKKTVYNKFPNAKGDLYTEKGKFELDSELSQKDLEYLLSQGYLEIVYKVEG